MNLGGYNLDTKREVYLRDPKGGGLFGMHYWSLHCSRSAILKCDSIDLNFVNKLP